MIDAIELAGTVFSGLTALVIEDVEDAGEVIRPQVKSAGGEVACPGCGAGTERVHGYHERTAADVPAGGRRVVVTARLRRLRCPVLGCWVQTFREQVPGTLERYQRRTARMTAQLAAVARELAGRASARLLPALGVRASRDTALRALLGIPLPLLEVPRVLGIDDFSLRCGLVYATVFIDAETGRRVDVVPGRTTDAVEEWLRSHPGVGVVCRDGSGAYGEAVRLLPSGPVTGVAAVSVSLGTRATISREASPRGRPHLPRSRTSWIAVRPTVGLFRVTLAGLGPQAPRVT